MELTVHHNRTETLLTNLCFHSPLSFPPNVLAFVLGTLTVITLCGNLLVIISIVYFRQLHTPTNYLVLSLAVADFLVGAFVLPFGIALFGNLCWRFQYRLCIIRGVFDITLCTSSILNLCFISIDRYFAVCQPLHYKAKITTDVTVSMIIVVWVVSAASAIVVVFGGHKEQRCVFIKNLKVGMVAPFICFCVPIIAMLTIYIKIFKVAQKQVRQITSTHVRISKSERKATRTLAIVMGVFIFCWTPFILCLMAVPFLNRLMPLMIIEMFKWLGWSNSTMNPFIYGLFYSWFRSAFKMILTGKIFQGDYTNAKLL